MGAQHGLSAATRCPPPPPPATIAAGAFVSIGGNFHTTAIGAGAFPTASNRINIGTALSNNLTGGYGSWQNFSDARFKRDVQADVPGLDFILRLRPVSYLRMPKPPNGGAATGSAWTPAP
ncbi:MAG: tail fiber domain-containing protein [Flavobacteriales bacterium]|nr:tail fiber domain-containing protein [Flavobacteriales bacterium]